MLPGGAGAPLGFERVGERDYKFATDAVAALRIDPAGDGLLLATPAGVRVWRDDGRPLSFAPAGTSVAWRSDRCALFNAARGEWRILEQPEAAAGCVICYSLDGAAPRPAELVAASRKLPWDHVERLCACGGRMNVWTAAGLAVDGGHRIVPTPAGCCSAAKRQPAIAGDALGALADAHRSLVDHYDDGNLLWLLFRDVLLRLPRHRQ